LSPMMAGADYREGVAALLEKRSPVFADPSADGDPLPPLPPTTT
jgi:hypothetical protein